MFERWFNELCNLTNMSGYTMDLSEEIHYRLGRSHSVWQTDRLLEMDSKDMSDVYRTSDNILLFPDI